MKDGIELAQSVTGKATMQAVAWRAILLVSALLVAGCTVTPSVTADKSQCNDSNGAICKPSGSDPNKEIATGSIDPNTNKPLSLGPDKVADEAPQVGGIKPETADRSSVYPQLASTDPNVASGLAPLGMPNVDISSRVAPKARESAHRVTVKQLSIRDAVAYAVLSHPLMGVQVAKLQAAGTDVKFSESALLPSLAVSAGTGISDFGTYSDYPRFMGSANLPGTMRTDVGFTFKQLVFDFGAAKSEVERNKALVDSERLKLVDEAEDIALRTVNSYMNILEKKEILAALDSTIANSQKLAELVSVNLSNGNGTKADVDRIQGKIIEIQGLRSDINSSYHIDLDDFYRLTKLEPMQVKKPRSITNELPKSLDAAIKEAQLSNPSVLALRSTSTSISHALAGAQAQKMPRMDLMSDATVKDYEGNHAASQGLVDSRLMLVMSYKIFDGGMLQAQIDKISAGKLETNYKTLDQEETVELNLRRLYESLSASHAKRMAAAQAVSTAENVNKLYIEQFKAGKRTIFELIDSNMSIFQLKKNAISSEYEELRSQYGILRNVGHLNDTMARN